MQVTVITDASFCPLTGAAGWATWIRYRNGTLVKHATAFKTRQVSAEEAETRAVINSIVMALYQSPAPLTHILVQTDCLNVVRKLDTAQIASIISKTCKTKYDVPLVELRHVKGHTSINLPRFWCNNWCDTQAKACMRLMRKKLG